MPPCGAVSGALRADGFLREDDHGGAVHRCIHGIMHLIEDHAEAAGIPVRFAATKLVEGDPRIEASSGWTPTKKK